MSNIYIQTSQIFPILEVIIKLKRLSWVKKYSAVLKASRNTLQLKIQAPSIHMAQANNDTLTWQTCLKVAKTVEKSWCIYYIIIRFEPQQFHIFDTALYNLSYHLYHAHK